MAATAADRGDATPGAPSRKQATLCLLIHPCTLHSPQMAAPSLAAPDMHHTPICICLHMCACVGISSRCGCRWRYARHELRRPWVYLPPYHWPCPPSSLPHLPSALHPPPFACCSPFSFTICMYETNQWCGWRRMRCALKCPSCSVTTEMPNPQLSPGLSLGPRNHFRPKPPASVHVTPILTVLQVWETR